MSSALFTEEHITGPWSVAVRPKFYWDRNGRMTQFERFIWANTTTLEYRRHFWHTTSDHADRASLRSLDR